MSEALSGWAPSSSGSAEIVRIKRLGRRISMSQPDRDWRGEVVDRLNELTALERCWDGYDGRPVKFDTANFTLQMLENICPSGSPAPQIIPGVNGDLQVEWHTDQGEIELDVLRPYFVNGWFVDAETGPAGIQMRLKSDFTMAAEWVRKVTEPTVAETAAA